MVMNIAETLEQVAAEYGDKPGLIEAKSGKKVSFSELNSRADGYSYYLQDQGVQPGDRVMLMVKPSADFICLTFGLFKLGVTIILIDPGMGYKNLLRCVEGVKPDVLVGIPKALLFTKLFPAPFTSVKKKFCCGNSFGILGKDMRKAVSLANPPYPVYKPQKDDLAAIIFTTGSTGPPKGVRYEHSIFAAQLTRIKEYYGIDHTYVDQPAFPLFALFSASLGACSVIPDMDPTRPAQVDPKKFINSIDKNNVTYSFGSPAIWNVVSRYCIDNGVTLPSLKKVLMAGAPVPGELLERMQAILSEDSQIFTPYGATESLPIVSMEGREIIEETWPETRIGKGTCVGRPLPGIDIRVIAITEGVIEEYSPDLDLAAGKIGEIIVRGNVVTRGYENNLQETQASKIKNSEDGTFWHRMGDTGYLDEKGRLWFCGRKAHRVVTRSQTLFTIPCEAIVNEHQDINRSALVGVKNKALNDVMPVLILEPVADFSGNEGKLISEALALAAKSKVTDTIQTALVHKSFPVDIRHNAKIFREKLAVWAEKELGVS